MIGPYPAQMWFSQGKGAACRAWKHASSDVRLDLSRTRRRTSGHPNNLVATCSLNSPSFTSLISHPLIRPQPETLHEMVYQTQLQAKFAHTVGEPVPKMNTE